MTTLIITGIMLLAALVAILAPRAIASDLSENKDGSTSRTAINLVRGGGIVLALVAIIPLVLTFVTVVPPRTVGIGVSFGKPIAVYDNGLHVKAPWTKVEKLDASVQNNIYKDDSAINVRLGNNSQARVDVSIQWQMKSDNAQKLFLDYKTFDSIQSNLVDRNLRTSLNQVMSTYNPLATVKDSNQNTSGADLQAMSEEVKKKLTEKISQDIDVISVNIPIIGFDDSTQNKIDELQAEIARTRVAEQKKNTANAEREANEVLERSISDNVLTSKCLDIVDRAGQSPLGCFPNSSGQPIIGSTK